MKHRSVIFIFILNIIVMFAILPTTAIAADVVPAGYNANDFTKMQAFLDQPSAVSGKTNGLQLNAAYDRSNPATWTGVEWNTASPKRIINIGEIGSEIPWYKKSLAGPLDLSGFTSLINLFCQDNQITSVNVAGDTALIRLTCATNSITSLNTSEAFALVYLYAGRNNLTSLDVSIHPNLRNLYCYNNRLTSLDLSNNMALRYLLCSDNLLTSLDVSHNTALTEISATNNRLTSLNLTANTALDDLGCSNNQLTDLVVSPLANFRFFYCQNNKLTQIHATIGGKIIALNADGNGYVELIGNIYSYPLQAKAIPHSGSTFTNWTTSGVPVSTSATYGIYAGAAYNLTAYFLQTVTFNRNGGNTDAVPTSVKVAYGETITTLPLPPTRTGYEFAGWYKESGCINAWDFSADTVTANRTLYAGWNISSYTVTFMNWDIPDLTYTIIDSPITLQEPVKPGYLFCGWYNEDTFVNKKTEIASGSTGDMELYAKWLQIYHLTYHLSGGTNSVNPEIYTIESALITLQDPTKTGYTFDGWYTDDTLINKVTNIPTGSSGDVELWAKWTAINYDITYNLDGGTNGDNPATYTIESSTALQDAVKTGYTFGGWYNGINFDTAIRVTNIPVESTGDVNLWVKWTAIDYDITYNLNGGINCDNPATYTIENALITLKDPTKAYYTFDGWYDSADFNTANQVTEIVANSTGTIELWAVWTAIDYDVTYNLDGGTNSDNPTIYTTESATALQDAVKIGYTFGGWYDDDTFSNKVTEITAGSTGKLELWAKWTEDTYVIAYNLDGSKNGVNPASYKITDTPIALQDPAKTGYAFDGWYKEASFANMVTHIGSGSTGNIVLWAKWSINKYTVTLDSLNASAVTTITADYGSKINKPADPTKTIYTFGGWYKESSCTNSWNFASDTVTDDTVLYAKWIYIAVENVILNTYAETLTVGDTYRLTVTIAPKNATQQNIIWSSSDEKIATVDQSGIVTAIGVGKATIVVRVNGVSATCSVNVMANNTSHATAATPQASLQPGAAMETVITPNLIEEDKATGMITVVFNAVDLPVGTVSILAPNGDIIHLNNTNTVQLQISKADLNQSGQFIVIALNKEDTPLSSYYIQIMNEEGQILAPNSGHSWNPVLLWILVGITGTGIIAIVVLVKR